MSAIVYTVSSRIHPIRPHRIHRAAGDAAREIIISGWRTHFQQLFARPTAGIEIIRFDLSVDIGKVGIAGIFLCRCLRKDDPGDDYGRKDGDDDDHKQDF